MFVDSPLIGENVEELGVRFPDMSEIYDKKLQEILRQTAKEIGLDLKEGIYILFYWISSCSFRYFQRAS